MHPYLMVTGFLLAMSLGSSGLQILVAVDYTSSQNGTQSPCVVMTCLEETTPTSGAQNISSLRFYRAGDVDTTTADPDAGSTSLETEVASVTAVQNNISLLTDQMVAIGLLRPNLASLRLEIFDEKDCEAKYYCEAETVTTDGTTHLRRRSARASSRKSLNTTVVKMNQARSKHESNTTVIETEHKGVKDSLNVSVENFSGRRHNVQSESADWAAETTIHLVSLVEQLHLKISSVEDKVEGMMEKVAHLQDNGGNIAQIEEKVKEIIGKFSAMEGMKDKLSSIEGIRDKMNSLDGKMSVLSGVRPPALEDVRETKVSLETFGTQMLKAMREELRISNANITTMVDSKFESIIINTSRPAAENCSTAFQSNEEPMNELMARVDSWVENVTVQISEKVDKALLSIVQSPNGTIQSLGLAALYQPTSDVFSGSGNSTQRLDAALVSNVTAPPPSRCVTTGPIYKPETFFPCVVTSTEPKSGTFQIPLHCNPLSTGNDWLVIQRRSVGDVSFFRGWHDYKYGFGSLHGDFWLGLEMIHNITSRGSFELRVDLEFKKKTYFILYSSFSVEPESMNYALVVGTSTGSASDSLEYHSGRAFSTFDKDNDNVRNENCAFNHGGAWWYGHCAESNLNGKWRGRGKKAMQWRGLTANKSASFTQMKIRRVQ